VEAGTVLMGGAILDGEGAMSGSVMLVDFPSLDALHDWLDHDPYVTGDVWQEYDVQPFQVAVGSWMPQS